QPCRGDSGGPAFLGANAIAGVVSRGDGACSDHVTYTRIDTARAALVNPYFVDTAPASVHTGDACFYEGHCVEGPCLQTKDDPLLWFCSQPCDGDGDCPAAMECASDGCRYRVPSPGALGHVCARDEECESDMCREAVCTISCQVDATVCPADFECRHTGALQYCFAKPADCGSCSSGSHAPLWLVFIYFVRRRRTGRASFRRGSRAARSDTARETRSGS
ncbi:MAG TPA: trypsin-like serine protease, partial [Kofleriaceae bacterium]